jgi:hypothetical protein
MHRTDLDVRALGFSLVPGGQMHRRPLFSTLLPSTRALMLFYESHHRPNVVLHTFSTLPSILWLRISILQTIPCCLGDVTFRFSPTPPD